MTTHILKIWPEFYDLLNVKHFEVRKNDRHFQKGDTVTLREWNRTGQHFVSLSDHTFPTLWKERTFQITYVLSDFEGIVPGYCILGLEEGQTDDS